MFRSIWCKLVGATLNRAASSSKLNRLTSTFSTATGDKSKLSSTNSDSSSSFVVTYLIDSCGLSDKEAITASEKINFKTKSKPDSVLALLKSYGFTEPDISRLIPRYPSILSCDPRKTLKPKFDFLKSKGLFGPDLVNLFSNDPRRILLYSLNKSIIPSFDIFKSIVHSDENVIRMIKRNPWLFSTTQLEKVMVNLELLRNQGVPQTKISEYLVRQPRVFTEDADRFKKIVEKTKKIGFNPLMTTFLVAIHALTSMTEANWRKKKHVYKRWGWSEDQIQLAFRRNPWCMTVAEKKIMAIMSFLVNEMGYESLSIAEYPTIISCSLKERIIPRCSVIRILVSRGLIKEMIPLRSISLMVDEAFLEKFVSKYEQQVPGLMKIFQGQLNYQELLQN